MDSSPKQLELSERLRALAAFLPIFQAPGFAFAHVESADEKTYTVPSLTEPARQFVKTCYRDGWVTADKGFNWPEWKDTGDAKSLGRDPDPERMARATPEDLSHLLTVISRQDRFVDGLLVGSFSRGLLTRIVERAAALLTEMS